MQPGKSCLSVSDQTEGDENQGKWMESGWKMDEGWGGGRGATHRKTKNRQRAE